MIINTMTNEQCYIAKVYKQHNSLVIVVPGEVCIGLQIEAGNHVVFVWSMKDGDMMFSKFVPVGAQDGQIRDNRDRENQGGRA